MRNNKECHMTFCLFVCLCVAVKKLQSNTNFFKLKVAIDYGCLDLCVFLIKFFDIQHAKTYTKDKCTSLDTQQFRKCDM